MQLGQRFLVHQWPDGCAVFDQATGNTHSLDPAAFAGFRAACCHEDVGQAIMMAMRAMHPESAGDELANLVQDCRQRLESCGLTESGITN